MSSSKRRFLVGAGLTLLALESLFVLSMVGPRSRAKLPPTVVQGSPLDSVPEGTSAAAQPAPASDPEESASKARKNDKPLAVGFDTLANFHLELGRPSSDPEADVAAVNRQIPAKMKELGGRKIRIAGFSIPYRVIGGKVRGILLCRSPISCCFGDTIKLNEWIEVDAEKIEYIPRINNVIVVVEGKLEVGAYAEKDGFIPSIYRIQADLVEQQ